MPGKLPPTLKEIGFEVIRQQGSSQSKSRWQRIDELIRHPVALILITSLFSVGVGTWLTSHYQASQRERDGITKSMDEVRAAIDRTEQVYAEFIDAAISLEDAIVSDAAKNRLEDAWAVFLGTHRTLRSKHTFESARLRQEMPLGSGVAFELITSGINVGVSLIKDCLTLGQTLSTPEESIHGKRLKCPSSQTFKGLQYAHERIRRVDACLMVMFRELRPDPADDFAPNLRVQKTSKGMLAADADCNNVTMLGYVPPEMRDISDTP
ncbi:hypothetical protein [Achromobacter sp. AGC25]